ncbi:Mrp/NBP35 family ATP-binding protein [Candidatus Methanosphaera massiliense]|jgi:ATP-binding protein involved in chromosome partitioning|uniref:Mrp/NBP35 family ATP-binding protein n=1 Tax=Methanosphaera TaxID=2316 RepID=UPI000DC4D7B8|nr:Mrp/NBP35 family ATP-binding protein [Candidatus Methanosphaera massiliense]MDD6285283.1 Mrp/NBP35 family ATP-binding protein [Methanobacteriaceae archaeon]MDE4078245.1 Mrp/NBP35 family ATP-binding protein [Candidatus Methanosphaera massiliense]MDY2744177.1 Mrp/NBP35 family ATP-binding protein [Methanosphaera sp.]RAP44432.1 MAG: ATP-binding protein [Methanosphaera sp. SHI1033]
MAHEHGAGLSEEDKKAIMEQNINITRNLSHIKYKIAVMSGKGGVGKSTVAVNLAQAFNAMGLKTALYDVDIHGPNVPKMLGIEDKKLNVKGNKLIPVETDDGILVASMAFLIENTGSPIIWRGPQKTGAIKQLISDVAWSNLDVMIFDNPPGTGDEPLTVLQMIPDLDAAVMVTTPSSVSEEDVTKCVTMTKMLHIDKIGLIENMSYFECPHCNEKINLFGDTKGKDFAEAMDVDYLGDLPFRTSVSESADKFDQPIVKSEPESAAAKEFMKIAETIKEKYMTKD